MEVGWRVKLYQMDRDGTWMDRGTGNITCQNEAYNGDRGGPALVLEFENEGHPKNVFFISPNCNYERQNGTSNTWRFNTLNYITFFQRT